MKAPLRYRHLFLSRHQNGNCLLCRYGR